MPHLYGPDSVCPFHHTSSSSPAPVSRVDSGGHPRGLAHVHGARVDAGQRVLEGQGEVAVFEVDQLPSIDTETDRSEC